jgi:hypothetical protein
MFQLPVEHCSKYSFAHINYILQHLIVLLDRVVVCAPSYRSDGHAPAGAETAVKLTLQLHHSRGPDQQALRQRRMGVACDRGTTTEQIWSLGGA